MESNKKSFTGVVTSDKMDKTIVVTVDNKTLHPPAGKKQLSHLPKVR